MRCFAKGRIADAPVKRADPNNGRHSVRSDIGKEGEGGEAEANRRRRREAHMTKRMTPRLQISMALS